MGKKLTTDEFIEKAIKVHGNKYDYSKVEYKTWNEKVCIICPIHGEFWQTPNDHLHGNGCSMCKLEKLRSAFSLGRDNFINRAILKFGNKYDYSKVDYVNGRTKVCIICPEHGEFWQTPETHLRSRGCPVCSKNIGYKPRKSFEDFKRIANMVHNNKYNYIEDSFEGFSKKVKIVCQNHGVFEQYVSHHLRGRGCPKCGVESASKKKTYSNEEFIELCNIVHNGKYDYSMTHFSNIKSRIDIICHKHGIFQQRADLHLNSKCGCPKCNASHGELKIEEYLKNNGIEYKVQYPVKLEQQMFARNNLRIDFYLPKHNTFIEFNGLQHYEFSPYFHESEDDFQKQVERDERLKDYCRKNKINLIVIKYNQIDKIEKILNSKIPKIKMLNIC